MSSEPHLHVAVPQQQGSFMKTTCTNRTSFYVCYVCLSLLKKKHMGKCFQRGILAPFPGRTLPTFTTRDHQFHRNLKRWLSGLEKLTALGFPTIPEIANIYKQERVKEYQMYMFKIDRHCWNGKLLGCSTLKYMKTLCYPCEEVMALEKWPGIHERAGNTQHLPNAVSR